MHPQANKAALPKHNYRQTNTCTHNLQQLGLSISKNSVMGCGPQVFGVQWGKNNNTCLLLFTEFTKTLHTLTDAVEIVKF